MLHSGRNHPPVNAKGPFFLFPPFLLNLAGGYWVKVQFHHPNRPIMRQRQTQELVAYIRYIAGIARSDSRMDVELLRQYVQSGDEAAFAAIVSRYAPLVWNSCCGILGPTTNAEDAFQAVFLTLAKKAPAVSGEQLPQWLRSVSCDVSLNCRRGIDRRHRHEFRTAEGQRKLDDGHLNGMIAVEEAAVIREELAHLPEQLRVPLMMYYFEGKTQAEVAEHYGIARPSAAERIERGLKHLWKRLQSRGIAVASVALISARLDSIAFGTPWVPEYLIERALSKAFTEQPGAGFVALAKRAYCSGWGVFAAYPVGMAILIGGVVAIGVSAFRSQGDVKIAADGVSLSVVSGEEKKLAPGLNWPRKISGSVVDAEGRPVPRARLSLFGRTWSNTPSAAMSTTTVDLRTSTANSV